MENRSARWYTSDLHFGHRRILDLGRSFADVDEMHAEIVDRWNAVVGEDDEVWVLGDLMLGPTSDLPERCLSQMRGVKVLVPGNHDQCWLGHGHAQTRSSRKHLYRVLVGGGFSRIEDCPRPHLIAGEEVGLCHFPYDGDHTAQVRYPEWRPEDNGGWLLHGHVHDLWRQNGRQINVGCDAWDFTPISERHVAEMITAGPRHVAVEASQATDLSARR